MPLEVSGLAIGSPLRQQSPKPPVFGLISASLITGASISLTTKPTLRPWWLRTQGATFTWFKDPLLPAETTATSAERFWLNARSQSAPNPRPNSSHVRDNHATFLCSDHIREVTRMIYRMLGSTGEKVSAIGVGGWHLGLKHVDEQLAIRIVRGAIDGGINFLDNCWDYNEGASETRMGRALGDGYRQKAFVMTKIDGRSKKAATKQLDQSLKRLRTDCIDLVQHHEILRFEDPHRIFDREGAHAALVAAKRAGKLRYIGFT